MVGTCRGLGFLSRSVALRGICRILSGTVSAADDGEGLAEGLHRILGSPAFADSGEEQLWRGSQRRGSVVDGVAAGFSAKRKCLPERDLSQGCLCSADAAFDHVQPR